MPKNIKRIFIIKAHENNKLRAAHAYFSSHKHQNMHCYTKISTGYNRKTKKEKFTYWK
jgi:hypothetical protein